METLKWTIDLHLCQDIVMLDSSQILLQHSSIVSFIFFFFSVEAKGNFYKQLLIHVNIDNNHLISQREITSEVKTLSLNLDSLHCRSRK